MNGIDEYELNVLDHCRIKPLIKQISLNDISPKFFLSSVYPKRTSYEIVQRHNKEIRRTIRKFFKSDIKMIFFLEKHLDPDTDNFLGFHRHVLIEDAPEDRWNNLDYYFTIRVIYKEDIGKYTPSGVHKGGSRDKKQ